MCTSPITITREYRGLGVTRSFTVPCGKCAECLARKRSELAALSVMQANVSGSVFFLTLTYRNEKLPVAITDDVDGVRRIVGFSRGYKGKAENFYNSVDIGPSGIGPAEAYSLCREDVKLWLKHCRREWSRKHPKQPLKFSYLVCGEYGEKRGRPHYHGLFYGLTREQVAFMASLWESRYGFSLVLPQTGVCSIDDAAKVSNYVTKYMFKGVYSKWIHLLGFVEKPRRQSSLHFGLTDDETILQISDFIKGAILSALRSCSLDALLLLNSAASLTAKKLSLLMASHTPFRGV